VGNGDVLLGRRSKNVLLEDYNVRFRRQRTGQVTVRSLSVADAVWWPVAMGRRGDRENKLLVVCGNGTTDLRAAAAARPHVERRVGGRESSPIAGIHLWLTGRFSNG